MVNFNIDYPFLSLFFDSVTIARGVSYARTERVVHLLSLMTKLNHTIVVHGQVQGSNKYPYKVMVEFSQQDIQGRCSCPMKHNCKHVVATLIQWERQQVNVPAERIIEPFPRDKLKSGLDYDAMRWIDQLGESFSENQNKHAIVYILNFATEMNGHKNTGLKVSACLARQLQKGGVGKPQPFYPSTNIKKHRATDKDLEIYALLDMLGNNAQPRNGEYLIPSGTSDLFLQRMLDTGRCYWEHVDGSPLQKMPQSKTATLQWQLDKDGTQRIGCFGAESMLLTHVMALTPPWTIDVSASQASQLDTALPDSVATMLLLAPSIAPNQAKKFVQQLQKTLGKEVNIPSPQAIKSIETRSPKPVPKLRVYQQEIACEEEGGEDYNAVNKSCVLADLTFSYDGETVGRHNTESPSEFLSSTIEDGKLIQITRDYESENHHIAQLENNSIIKLDDQESFYPQSPQDNARYLISEQSDLDDIINFGEQTSQQLETAGWEIDFDAEPFYDMLEIDEWYTDLDEKSEYDWFKLDLGVLVNDEKVSLLPHLIEAIDHLELSEDQEHYYLKLADKQVLPIPAERIRLIMGALTQFIDPDRLGTDLRVARCNASLLVEIEKAFNKTKLRWIGGQRLRELGQRLSKFKSIKSVKPPKKSFDAVLRSYQQAGVNWLQFLREYELNGILADDMGLGKTIQTLAHILIEKHKKRLTQPCLIVAPTSVVSNWQVEAGRFTPSLSVLVLRGPDRKMNFESISQYDIVVTTYPLIVRDKEAILSHSYHMLILDEAQFIKNAQAKMTQIVQQIQAKHRICLTGTPLENHLGELWSLFNFLMPGFLGNAKHFKQSYRTPIEKKQDTASLSRLTHIVKPFILRRTKEEVAPELPKKTEIIQKATLEPRQRDLYESIRLAMHKKVRDAIDKKGIGRCQIIILDALLKLRQACCDPRLVKLPAAQKVKGSAKLTLLSEMLVEMVDEGRKILLFSQFTSMLKLIEEVLGKKGIKYVKLTGNTKNRARPIASFQAGEVPVFLISLKAGGTGINLTTADTVIHYDPWWNPAVENQATDRAYRIGQNKPVFVYKLVAEDTVEEKIIAMQEKKKSLMTALFSGKNNKAKLSRKDLDYLLS